MIGVGTEVRVRPENGTLSLSEYELADQTIKGIAYAITIFPSQCDIPPSGIHYYLFSAPKGHYVLNGFNAPKLNLLLMSLKSKRACELCRGFSFRRMIRFKSSIAHKRQEKRPSVAKGRPRVLVAQRSKNLVHFLVCTLVEFSRTYFDVE